MYLDEPTGNIQHDLALLLAEGEAESDRAIQCAAELLRRNAPLPYNCRWEYIALNCGWEHLSETCRYDRDRPSLCYDV